jgi:adenylosuccinate lyase
VIDKLLVYPERMQANLDRMGGLSTRSACCWR